jgi:hypothetical protein
LLQQLNGGAMLEWAVVREGPLDRWVRREVEALLRPYRAKGTVRKGGGKGRRKH